MQRSPQTSAPEARRPRPSTVIFAALALAGLVLANVLGRFQVQADVTLEGDADAAGLSAIRTTDAGWPWTYLVIRSHRTWPLAYLEDGVARRSLLAVVLNAVSMFAIVLGGSWIFSQWLRRRRRLLQFGLMDVALLTTAAALVLGLVLVPRWQHARDAAVIGAIDVQPSSWRGRSPLRQAIWQPDRHEWLRWIVGEKWLPPGSHVVAIDVEGLRAADVARLPRLSVIKLRGTVKVEDLQALASLPELECLDLSSVRLERSDDARNATEGSPRNAAEGVPYTPITLPLPRLKRLFARRSTLTGGEFSGCTGLEELDLSRVSIDGSSAAAIGRLTSLRVLNLRRAFIDDEGVQHLSKLNQLQVLDLSGTGVTDEGLKHLRGLPSLRTLWLTDTAISDRGLTALEDCPQLATVWVVGSQVTPRGVARLRAARKERMASVGR